MSWQDSMAKVKIIEEIIWHIQRVLVLFFLKKYIKLYMLHGQAKRK